MLIVPKKNRSQPKVVDDGLVYLDAAKLDRARVAAGMSLRDLATQSDVAWNTLRKLAAGEGVFPHVAHKVAVTLKRDVLSMLAERDPRYEPPLAQLAAADWEWELDDYLDPGRRASNGLHYFVCRMRHRHMAGRLGRGKFYALSGLSERERSEKRLHLLRHPEVCSRVRSNPFVAETYSVTPVGQDVGWWIVDRWIDGRTLAEQLDARAWPAEQLPRLAAELLRGLDGLHGAGVVFRELAPCRILIAADDGRAVLTDFELAKLMDNVPSVSGDWPTDPYRAPEVESGHVTAASDLFSWSRLLLHAAAGALPPMGGERETLAGLDLPKKMKSLLADCLSVVAAKRPQSATDALSVVERWKVTT